MEVTVTIRAEDLDAGRLALLLQALGVDPPKKPKSTHAPRGSVDESVMRAAALIYNSTNSGTPSIAVSEQLGINIATARYAVTKARKAGLIPPYSRSRS
jgi:hypothetical protein